MTHFFFFIECAPRSPFLDTRNQKECRNKYIKHLQSQILSSAVDALGQRRGRRHAVVAWTCPLLAVPGARRGFSFRVLGLCFLGFLDFRPRMRLENIARSPPLECCGKRATYFSPIFCLFGIGVATFYLEIKKNWSIHSFFCSPITQPFYFFFLVAHARKVCSSHNLPKDGSTTTDAHQLCAALGL